MKPAPKCCQETGHNFSLTNMVHGDDYGLRKQVVFCTKCGETRNLEVATQEEKESNVGQGA